MANEGKICSFTSEQLGELAMLYMQSKDISDYTPENLYKEYRRVYLEMKNVQVNMNQEIRDNLPEKVNHSKRGDTS